MAPAGTSTTRMSNLRHSKKSKLQISQHTRRRQNLSGLDGLLTVVRHSLPCKIQRCKLRASHHVYMATLSTKPPLKDMNLIPYLHSLDKQAGEPFHYNLCFYRLCRVSQRDASRDRYLQRLTCLPNHLTTLKNTSRLSSQPSIRELVIHKTS